MKPILQLNKYFIWNYNHFGENKKKVWIKILKNQWKDESEVMAQRNHSLR